MMAVEVSTPDDVGSVLTDLTAQRGASVHHVGMLDGAHVVNADVPLVTMVGYAAVLRKMTSGRHVALLLVWISHEDSGT